MANSVGKMVWNYAKPGGGLLSTSHLVKQPGGGEDSNPILNGGRVHGTYYIKWLEAMPNTGGGGRGRGAG